MFKAANKLKKHWIEMMIMAYLLLKPFYVLSSSVQLADMLLLALGIAVVAREFKYQIPKAVERAYLWFVLFVIWSCVVNFAWYISLFDKANKYSVEGLIKGSVYLIFNGLAMYIMFMLYRIIGIRLYSVIAHGAFFSVMLQVIMSFVLYDASLRRQVIGFNNPNQLGYYAILMLTIAIIWGMYLKSWELYIFVLGSLYLILLSMSKASIVAAIVMLGACLVYRYNNKGFFNRKVKIAIIITGCLAIIVIAIYGIYSGKSTLFQQIVERMSNITTEVDSNFGNGRGYNRIFEMDNNILWGMGEGANGRFDIMKGNEVHSTYISILISYGVIGFGIWIFSLIQFIFVRGKEWIVLLAGMGVILYWLTHNGIRNTIFWMCIALLSIYIREYKKEEL